MRKKSKIGIIVIILLLMVGFATVSTTLIINGTLRIGTNDDFDVIFTKAILDGTDVSKTVISEDGKTITYTTNDLSLVGDQSKLDFEVKNTSTQYDAEVEIICETLGTNSNNRYTIETNVAEFIEAQTRENGYIKITLDVNSVDELKEQFVCSITANAIERTDVAIEYTDDANGILFNPENSNWSVSTVEEALNYLRERNGS